MNTTELILIDLSSIAHPIWHTCQADPDLNACSRQVIARVHSLAGDHRHVAICCDSGPSFRNGLSAAYKANRPERDAALQHQITVAREQLEADGFPVWAVKNFEADDIIASAVRQALENTALEVLVVSADKDLLQLVAPRVRVMSAATGVMFGPPEVEAKFGVPPEKMRDFLTLVGDKSDNVTGASGIGEVKAAALLKRFKDLDHLYADLDEVGPVELMIQPSTAKSLKEFKAALPMTRALITLRSDVPLLFEQVMTDRVPSAIAQFGVEDDETPLEEDPAHQTDVVCACSPNQPATPTPARDDSWKRDEAEGGTAIAVREPQIVTPAPVEYERQLDPRSMREAVSFSKDIYLSKMFTDYGTPQAVLSTVMLGRELGIPAMGSLRTIHIIEGKHSLSASLMAALVLKSGIAEYFEPISFDEKQATYETLRKGARNPVRLTHTFEMGMKAWPKSKPDWEKAFLASGWGRNPTDMVVARAQSRLARLVYPDLLAGLYTPEELAEFKEAA